MKPITVKTEQEFIKDYGKNWGSIHFYGLNALKDFKTTVPKRLVGKIIELQDHQYHEFIATGVLRMDYTEFITTDMISWELSRELEFFDDVKVNKKVDIYQSRMTQRFKINTEYHIVKPSIYTDRLKSYKV